MQRTIDEKYMARTLRLSRKHWGISAPNPAVGALVVKNGRIVAEGVHKKAGEAHGEALALALAGEQAKGATLYVNLEPCRHQGRTPACTNAIITSGVSRVVYGIGDPNPVAGGGGSLLSAQGLEVTGGVLMRECAYEHRMFLISNRLKRPYVILKAATSLDGRIATAKGHSQWITGEGSRKKAHWLRSRMEAIMVGRGTLMADNPSLTCRLPGYHGRQPFKVVLDSRLGMPLSANVLKQAHNLAVVCGKEASPQKERALIDLGARVWRVGVDEQGGLDLPRIMRRLYEEGITSLMLEGGADLAFSMLRQDLVDELWQFVAPKIIGGRTAPGFAGGQGFASLSQAVNFSKPRISRLGDDILLMCQNKRREELLCLPD